MAEVIIKSNGEKYILCHGNADRRTEVSVGMQVKDNHCFCCALHCGRMENMKYQITAYLFLACS